MVFAYGHCYVWNNSKDLSAQLAGKVTLVYKEDQEEMVTGVDQARRYPVALIHNTYSNCP